MEKSGDLQVWMQTSFLHPQQTMRLLGLYRAEISKHRSAAEVTANFPYQTLLIF